MAASHTRTPEEHRLFQVALDTFGFGPSKCWRIVDCWQSQSAKDAHDVAQEAANPGRRRRGDILRPRQKLRHPWRLTT